MKTQILALSLWASTLISLVNAQDDFSCALSCVNVVPSNISCNYSDPSCYCTELEPLLDCIRSACANDPNLSEALSSYTSVCGAYGYNSAPALTNGGSNPIPTPSANDPVTVNVLPNDRRITYDPADSWKDANSATLQSGVGSCSNGTKITKDLDAKFTFTFSGTDISLFLVPSSAGGNVTVQIDGNPATTLSTYHGGGSSAGGTDQCVPSKVFTKGDLTETTHQITVKNGAGIQGSGGGTLEFNNIIYKGRGAVGTVVNKKGVSPAVIGGSVGGVVGAMVLIGSGILFILYRKKQQSSNKTPNQPLMFQPANPSFATTNTPFSAPSQSSSPIPTRDFTSVGYSGPPPHLQQPTLANIPPNGGNQDQTVRPLSYATDQPMRAVSFATDQPSRPVTMWVEHAGQTDSATINTTTTSYTPPPGQQPSQFNPYYGASYNGAPN